MRSHETCVQNTLGKLHLHNRIDLVRYAIEHGLAGESDRRQGNLARHLSAAP
jgi:hypothetical protein